MDSGISGRTVCRLRSLRFRKVHRRCVTQRARVDELPDLAVTHAGQSMVCVEITRRQPEVSSPRLPASTWSCTENQYQPLS
ncbi:hypothetical protein O9992_24200 [Vibrio lentus]|nr:hypothetical protein [Vibrio lentus]